MARIMLLANFLFLALAALPAGAGDVPFTLRSTIEDEYPGAQSVATGDLDADGRLDIVAAGVDSASIAWWRNLGGGSYTRHNIATGVASLSDVAIADMNHDGWLDIVVTATGTSDAVGWFLNDGTPADGSWSLFLIATAFDGARSVSAGDFNGDGMTDVVAVAEDDNEVSVAFNNTGTGVGWSYEVIDSAFDGAIWVSAGDIDRDGNLDVAAVATGSDLVSWWSRDAGGGTWTEHTIAPLAFPTSIELADMDHDGDLDALATEATSEIRWWTNDGSGGGWTEHLIGDPTGIAWSAKIIDLDLDGDADVVYSSSSEVGWYENADGDALTWVGHTLDDGFVNGVDIATDDLDADGDPDLTAVASSEGDLVVWQNLSIHRSAAFPDSMVIDAVTDLCRDLDAVDIDGDGDLDLLNAQHSAELISWSENPGDSGSSWAEHIVRTAIVAEATAAGDLDGDGFIDIVGASNDHLLWWHSNGSGGWAENTISSSTSVKDGVELADLDLDGDLDIVLSSYSSGIDWYENSGTGGSFTERFVTSGYPWDADSVQLADIDQDGDLDIVATDFAAVRWTPNNLRDSGSFGADIIIADGLTEPRSIAAGDIDGDHDLDVAVADQSGGTVMWWPNSSGDGASWGSVTIVDDTVSGPRVIRLADLDRDGDLDIALAAEDGSTSDSVVGWYENLNGDGSSWTLHTLETGLVRPQTLVAQDFDNNGAVDIAYNSYGSEETRLRSNRGAQATIASAASGAGVVDVMTPVDVIEFTVTHQGRSGDTDAELASVKLELEDGLGNPLTSSEADRLFEYIMVFEDNDDSGDFDSSLDSEAASINSFVLADGVQVIPFTDGSERVRITHGQPKLFFIVIVFANDAVLHHPKQVDLTHLVSASVVEDRDHDIALSLEPAADASSGLLEPYDPDLIFADDFELGNDGAWSFSSP